jgi:hypothetical protein
VLAAFAHVRQESGVIFDPSLANTYAPASVIFVTASAWIRTSVNHALPRSIGFSSYALCAVTMGPASCPCNFISVAAATDYFPFREMAGSNFAGIATIAQALPINLSIHVFCANT